MPDTKALPSLPEAMLPSLPTVTVSTAPSIFILYYRHGNVPMTQQLQFHYPGDMRAAIARGRAYCETVGWRFIMVKPFLVNLDEEEKKYSA